MVDDFEAAFDALGQRLLDNAGGGLTRAEQRFNDLTRPLAKLVDEIPRLFESDDPAAIADTLLELLAKVAGFVEQLTIDHIRTHAGVIVDIVQTEFGLDSATLEHAVLAAARRHRREAGDDPRRPRRHPALEPSGDRVDDAPDRAPGEGLDPLPRAQRRPPRDADLRRVATVHRRRVEEARVPGQRHRRRARRAPRASRTSCRSPASARARSAPATPRPRRSSRSANTSGTRAGCSATRTSPGTRSGRARATSGSTAPARRSRAATAPTAST